MNTTLPARLPANLESAVQRVRMAARTAAERTVDSLGLAALSSNNVFHRDGLLGAQFELNRKLAIFALTFNETLDGRVAREVGALDGSSSHGGLTSWDALSLVDDHEVEIQVSADRFALEIAHNCEWEIRELDAYIGTLLRLGRADPEHNPLRAEVVGQAMIRAVESVSDRHEVRKVLSTEIGRSLAQAMRETYVDIVNDLRQSGIKPVGLSVRQRPSDSGRGTGAGSLHGGLDDSSGHGLTASGRLTQRFGTGGTSGRGGFPSSGHGGMGHGHGGGTPMGHVDGQMMSLIRRLSHSSAAIHDMAGDAYGGDWSDGGEGVGMGVMMAPNVIMAHRDELRQAATGAIDHMVIDVIAGLFDQILSDPKVPPQMARQIGRLQLPVLRAALGDTSFFSSRRHPVRRFVNRIATLGSAVDDFDSDEGQALLTRVRELVQEIVEGDFEQIEVYEHKLNALESFIAEQAKAQVQADGGTDQLLARKEDHLRVAQRFAQQLDGALQPLPVPEFLRQFLGQVWSRAMASAELETGTDSALTRRMREIGRELVMSVQPKSLPAQRAAFLRQLPQLMKDLNAGLDRIRCAETVRRDFFAQLLPAHAESLKGQSLSTLEHNLLAKQVDGVLATPVPKPAELPPLSSTGLPVLRDAVQASDFTAEEAKAVGLVDEASVDWNGKVDIDLTAEPELTSADIDIAGLPPPEPVEPMRGKSLADHVQIGFAYQMHVEGAWEKVRLAHVSSARTFFVFKHGAKQRKTISMTYRMLARMCETGRMRAFENAYLIERATARARRQLAQVSPGAPSA
ncbi:DUF1631 family protein [Ideonella sp. A 288]|uniref:DUF1631 family protein n=1 Tax=Ideonella sp. A 288 TaxID=1962181 RepID=UPI000B4BE349|nr:DUF1631 family protein [Ideonella sp. A 288]